MLNPLFEFQSLWSYEVTTVFTRTLWTGLRPLLKVTEQSRALHPGGLASAPPVCKNEAPLPAIEWRQAGGIPPYLQKGQPLWSSQTFNWLGLTHRIKEVGRLHSVCQFKHEPHTENSLKDTPRIMFDRMSGHLVAQSNARIKLTITVAGGGRKMWYLSSGSLFLGHAQRIIAENWISILLLIWLCLYPVITWHYSAVSFLREDFILSMICSCHCYLEYLIYIF